tara:strand:- start:65 stop:244 length:180 start_codon:yes stop_codon:yes gene_type:complete
MPKKPYEFRGFDQYMFIDSPEGRAAILQKRTTGRTDRYYSTTTKRRMARFNFKKVRRLE